jgi:hypothetical protein
VDHIFVRGLERRGGQARLVVPGTMPTGWGAVSLSDHAGVSAVLELGPEDLPGSAMA